MKTENSTPTPKTEKTTNHFTTTISKCNEETYKDSKQLCETLGCSMKDLVWYSLKLVTKDVNLQPKSFGLSR